MSRTPTPLADLHAWHSAALLDIDAAPVTEDPQCGWFKRRLVKGGPFVPARIWMYQPTDESGELCGDEILQCEVDGQCADPGQHWLTLCNYPITRQEFDFLTATRAWAQSHAPDEPYANPRQPIDWAKIPTPQFAPKERL